MPGLDWGDVPTWVGSVGTGAALLIAAVAYRKSVHDSNRIQAARVTVWVEKASDSDDRLVYLKNTSEGAVYFATIFFEREPGKPHLASPYYSTQKNVLGRWESLGPGREVSAEFWREYSDPSIPWLYFQDSNGVEWVRDHRARLARKDYFFSRVDDYTFAKTRTAALRYYAAALRIFVAAYLSATVSANADLPKRAKKAMGRIKPSRKKPPSGKDES
jgi:hypothetical protein